MALLSESRNFREVAGRLLTAGQPSEAQLADAAGRDRVTAFVGLYRVLCEGWVAEKAFEPMRTVWEPDPVWKQFIANMLQRGQR